MRHLAEANTEMHKSFTVKIVCVFDGLARMQLIGPVYLAGI